MNNQQLIPKNGNVILKPVESQDLTYGSIIIPDLGKETPELAEVIASSSTYNWHIGQLVPSEFQPGDLVLIPKIGVLKTTIAGEDFFICKATEILSSIKTQ